MTREQHMGRWIAAFGDADVLSVCLDTHMSITGAGDPLADDDLFTRLALLSERLAVWNRRAGFSESFDNAVRQLVVVTNMEATEEVIRRGFVITGKTQEKP